MCLFWSIQCFRDWLWSFIKSFLWIFMIFVNFWGFVDLFEPYGMFLFCFGFICIFVCRFDTFDIEFGSFIKIFWLLGFLKFFYDFSSVFWELIRNSWFISRNFCFLSEFFDSFRFIEDFFWFCESFLWILKISVNFFRFLWIFWNFMACSWLVADFYISFLVFSVLRDWFRLFIKSFYFLGFLMFF